VNQPAIREVLIASTLLGLGVPAEAQSSRVVTSAINVTGMYDENVLWRPNAQSDHVWRLTPSIDLTRESVRSRWRLDGLLDAEWYSRYRELSSPAARQHVATTWDFRPTNVDQLGLTAGYDSSRNPAEINAATGLFLGRTRAWRWFAGPEYIRAVSGRTRLLSTYRLTGEFSEITPGVTIHAGEFGVAQRLSERNEITPSYLAEIFMFRVGERVYSHRGMARWTHRLTSSVRADLGGGARVAQGQVTPVVDVRISRHAGWSDASAGYTFDRVTTLGVPQLVEVHNVLASVRHHKPEGLDASLNGGLYRSGLNQQIANVYHVGGEFKFPVVRPLYISVASTVDYQRGRLGIPLLELFDLSDVASGPLFLVPPAAPIRRSTLMVSVVLSGTARSAAGPGELSPPERDRFGREPDGRNGRRR